jgi:enamine deaminase RidA (YjgF/YER057c/UK114 family)
VGRSHRLQPRGPGRKSDRSRRDDGAGDSAYEQARAALQAIGDALTELGASLADVVRTRMFVVEIERNADDVGRAHGEVFGDVKPAAAMYGVTGLLRPEMVVEIEATAFKDP